MQARVVFLISDLCTYPLLWTVMLCTCGSCAVAAEVHMSWPQAGAAAGGIKGVGLELVAVVVLSRGRHVNPAESPLSCAACGCVFSAPK